MLLDGGIRRGTDVPRAVRPGSRDAGPGPARPATPTTSRSAWPTLFGRLFPGGALSLTAFPMLARILYERGLGNSSLGRLSLLAASIDDAVAWCLLALLSALHLGSGLDGAVRTIVLSAVFVTVMLTVVKLALRPLGREFTRTGDLGPTAMYIVVLVPLVAGWLTDWIGIHAILGGFVAGLVMPRDPRFRAALHGRMMAVVTTLLLPVFFTFSGLNTDLEGIAWGGMLVAFVAIMAAGFTGSTSAARWRCARSASAGGTPTRSAG